jgi:hypothetical protein
MKLPSTVRGPFGNRFKINSENIGSVVLSLDHLGRLAEKGKCVVIGDRTPWVVSAGWAINWSGRIWLDLFRRGVVWEYITKSQVRENHECLP